MMKRSHLASMALVAVGAVLGWAVAAGRLDLTQPATAAVERTAPTGPAIAAPVRSCCDAGAHPAALATVAAHNTAVAARAAQDGKKPNILVIWGDDIGQSNISAYSHGVMGYRTPNIDRLAREGMMFTDYYAEQSCTAGRAAFIMG